MTKTSAIMIFVLGPTLLVAGIPLGIIKEEVTRYRFLSNQLGSIEVPYTVEVFPYQSIAVLLMVAGLILMIVGINIAKKDQSHIDSS